MTQARSLTVVPNQPGTYLLTYRCVRRAFLCGFDRLTGSDFNHRRQWFVDRLRVLLDAFAVEVLAFTLMSNHYHLVVHVDPTKAAQMSDEDVWRRWCSTLARANDEELPPLPDAERIAELRERLGSLSWFMKGLNEPIARRANREDECTGRFWEGRFHCRCLLDDAAVVSAMAYVDLNPVRAGVVKRVEDSPWTSIAQRCRDESEVSARERSRMVPIRPLDKTGVPAMSLAQYLELLNYAARRSPSDEQDAQPGDRPPIAVRLGFAGRRWACALARFRFGFGRFVGSPPTWQAASEQAGMLRLRGRSMVRVMFVG